MAGKKKLSISEITDLMNKYCDNIREIIYRAAQNIPAERSCGCKDALSDASL
jgi:hypothetical protein